MQGFGIDTLLMKAILQTFWTKGLRPIGGNVVLNHGESEKSKDEYSQHDHANRANLCVERLPSKHARKLGVGNIEHCDVVDIAFPFLGVGKLAILVNDGVGFPPSDFADHACNTSSAVL